MYASFQLNPKSISDSTQVGTDFYVYHYQKIAASDTQNKNIKWSNAGWKMGQKSAFEKEWKTTYK